MTNYRPISLLKVFSKVLEKFMYNRLNHHMHTNNTLVPEQCGFSQVKSIENAVFKLTDRILKSINHEMHVGGIFCDLAKAFDCVNHGSLLVKLYYYGIQGTVANWFRFYLTNRKQKNEIKSFAKFSSKWGTVKQGIPQRSILGPMLFLIYINDLPPTKKVYQSPFYLLMTPV
jgi:hypothetical protein